MTSMSSKSLDNDLREIFQLVDRDGGGTSKNYVTVYII